MIDRWFIGLYMVYFMETPSLNGWEMVVAPCQEPPIPPHSVLDHLGENPKENHYEIGFLVGGIPTPLKNMKVNWDDYSQYMEK